MCENKEYKKYKPIKKVSKKSLSECKKKHRTTIAASIHKEVKLIVWKRDGHEYIFCHRRVPWNYANSHNIKRSHLGLGIKENIFTACSTCHTKFDDSKERKDMLPTIIKYFKTKYSNWNEQDLHFHKYNFEKKD